MKREQAKSMKELLPLFIQEMGLGPGLDEVRVSTLWDELLGPAIISATQQKRLKEGKLYVRLHSSVVRNHLFTERKNIMMKINEVLGKKLITEIILY
jgi:predicted nucleic acid-binding Zn ribbon protein